MRTVLLSACFLVLASAFGTPVFAQPRPNAPRPQPAPQQPQQPPPPVEEEEEEEEEEEVPEDASGTPQLRRPQFEQPNVQAPATAEEEYEQTATGEEEYEETATGERNPPRGEEEEEEEGEVVPEEDETRLNPPPGRESDPVSASAWSSPESVLTLHGYFRTRGELQDSFHLGWGLNGIVEGNEQYNPYPFRSFRAVEARTNVEGGCGRGTLGNNCNDTALIYANMRMRLQPQINLSDDVRIKMWVDVLDNVVLGSTPDGSFDLGARSPFASPGSFPTQLPPTSGFNSVGNSILVRRAWAEIRDRALGELRFGRMGFHWGLGLFANSGDNLDGDYSTDVDRVMLMTKLAGIYFAAAYDFASNGIAQNVGRERLVPGGTSYLNGTTYDPALPYDPTRLDGSDQFFFAVARRSTPEEQALTLQRGDFVLNAGAMFIYRSQFLDSAQDPVTGASRLVQRGLELFVPDVWAQFLYGDLRLEFEAVMIGGTVRNIGDATVPTVGQHYGIMQLGAAFEGEYRLLDDKLGIYFATGLASGDNDVEGLSAYNDSANQLSTNRTISTMRFHPNYRIDLILWRTIMRQISGAYYFRPGVSYDLIRGEFGELLGARVDVVYSRATQTLQTWGNQEDLGVEIDGTVYFRSDDGPEILDGFYAIAQYGILFPLAGLGSTPVAGMSPNSTMAPALQNAQTLRLILGVQF